MAETKPEFIHKELLQMRDITLNLETPAKPDVEDLLADTSWGTPGGTVYSNINARAAVRAMINPFYLTLRKSDQLMGCFGLSGRLTQEQNEELPYWLLRFFSIQKSVRQKDIDHSNKDKSREARKGEGNSMVKKVAGRFFSKPEGLELYGKSSEKSIIIALIEKENERSLGMSDSMGFTPIRQFRTLAVSRFFPKADKDAGLIKEEEKVEMLEKLNETYKNHCLYFKEHLFLTGKYYVLRKNGKIVAGLVANPAAWKMEELPGLTGKLAMNVVPKIPLLSRMFNPHHWRFLGMEGFYYEPGQINYLHTLMESVMKMTGYYAGLFWLDNNGQQFRDFMATKKKLGILNNFQNETPAEVVGRFNNIPEETIEGMKNKPAYISATDII